MIQTIGITVLWCFLFGYLIIASIDFGAGFFAYYEKLTRKELIINKIISRYLSPVWEVTNVFFVFFFVGIVGFFPKAAYYLGTTLLVPGSIALVLLAIRGSFYAFNNYSVKENRFYAFLYGVTGLLIPAALSTTLTISEGGFVIENKNQVVFLANKLITSFYSWSVVLLALVSVLYISSSFLTYYARRAEDDDAERILRRFALLWSLPTILASILVFVGIREHNTVHYNNMMHMIWIFALSFLCFLIAVSLVYQRKNYGLGFIFVIFQFFFAFFGYGATHLPYILYPYIKIEASFTLPQMGTALIIAFILGFVLLVPSIILLLRLFIFDAKYVKGRR